jgi:hypothetical protein
VETANTAAKAAAATIRIVIMSDLPKSDTGAEHTAISLDREVGRREAGRREEHRHWNSFQRATELVIVRSFADANLPGDGAFAEAAEVSALMATWAVAVVLIDGWVVRRLNPPATPRKAGPARIDAVWCAFALRMCKTTPSRCRSTPPTQRKRADFGARRAAELGRCNERPRVRPAADREVYFKNWLRVLERAWKGGSGAVLGRARSWCAFGRSALALRSYGCATCPPFRRCGQARRRAPGR